MVFVGNSGLGGTVLGQSGTTFDLGASQMVRGFTWQARNFTGLTPTAGELWVSDNPTSSYVKVGDWTMPVLAAGQNYTVNLGTGNALQGRYVQLGNLTGMNDSNPPQAVEITILEPSNRPNTIHPAACREYHRYIRHSN